MSPGEKGAAFTTDLVERLQADIDAAKMQAQLAVEQLQRASDPPDAPTLAYVSVAMDRAYTALESAFLRIARDIDGNTPTGDGWHAALLHQMTLPIQDKRTAVLSADSARGLDPLRRHRHWLRHAYAATFEWSLMSETVRGFSDAVSSVAGDLRGFVGFLEAAADE